MNAIRRWSGVSPGWALTAAALALTIALLIPATASAFANFSNGALTVTGGEGKIVPRCASDGQITVSGVYVDNGPAYCRDLRRIEASSGISGLFDFSQLPDDLGGGPRTATRSTAPPETTLSSAVVDSTSCSAVSAATP